MYEQQQNQQQVPYQQYPQQQQQQQQQQFVVQPVMVAQGIPVQNYPQQQPMQVQNLNQYPMQQQAGVVVAVIDADLVKQNQLRDIAVQFKRINECWGIMIFVLLIIYGFKLGFSASTTLSFVGIAFVIIEYCCWGYACQDGRLSMLKQEYNRLPRMAKFVKISIPCQIIGHGLIVIDDISSNNILISSLIIIIEIYIVYFKYFKLVKCANDIEKFIQLYDTDAAQKGNPTSQQVLQQVFFSENQQ